MLKKLKYYEFSKKLLVFVEFMILAVFILTTISVVQGNTDALVGLITGVFSLASISFGFYYWKAKNENIRKYADKKLTQEEAKAIINKVYGASFSIHESEDN